MPPYECEISTEFFEIQINFENLTLLPPRPPLGPNIQKINFLAPPLVVMGHSCHRWMFVSVLQYYISAAIYVFLFSSKLFG